MRAALFYARPGLMGQADAVSYKSENVASFLDKISSAVFDRVINVKDPKYGAKGDGVTDDTAAIQAAIADARLKPYNRAYGVVDPTNPYFESSSMLLFPPGRYVVTNSLWFGVDSGAAGWDAAKIVESVSGYGAVIVGKTNGKPVLDLSGAFGMKVDGLSIFGDNSAKPNVGILLSRSGNAAGDNPSAGAHRFSNVNVHGDFSLSCVYNYASEINYFDHCYMYQNSGLAVYIGTCNNARFAVTSSFCTIATTVQSAYADFFTGGIYKNSTGNATPNGAVFYIESMDFGPSWMNSYIDGSGAVYMPNIYLCNAQGLTSAATASFNQSVRAIGCTFEYRDSTDFIVVGADHNVNDLTIDGNSITANTAGGFAHLKINAGGRVKNLNAQRTSGDVAGNPFVIAGPGDVLNEVLSFSPMNTTVAGTGWAATDASLTRDGVAHTFDATAYGVPKTAKFLAVKVLAACTAAGANNSFAMRAVGGGIGGAQDFVVTPAVNGIEAVSEGLVPLVNGKFDYQVPANFNLLRVAFKGYFY